MKLVIAIIQDQDRLKLAKALRQAEFQFTRLATTGGFLKHGNATFLLAVKDEQLDQLLEIIKAHSQTRTEYLPPAVASTLLDQMPTQPIEVTVNGATVFIVPIEKMIKF